MPFQDMVRQLWAMETAEIPMYGHMAEIAPNPVWREQFLIFQQEQMLNAQYLANLMGATPTAGEAAQMPRPATFQDGLRRMQQEELNQIRTYQDAILAAPNPAIRMHLIELQWRQIRQFFWFNYMDTLMIAGQGAQFGWG